MLKDLVEKKIKDCVKKRYAYRIILLKSKIEKFQRDKKEHKDVIEETQEQLEKEEKLHENYEDMIIKFKRIEASKTG